MEGIRREVKVDETEKVQFVAFLPVHNQIGTFATIMNIGEIAL